MRRALAVALLLAAAGTARAERPARDPERGRTIYRSRCAICHGPDGRGDGAAARDLDPPPRDFTGGVYKHRSTASGEPPRDEDLLRTITRGMPGTAMPGWSRLPELDRWHLVDYLLSLAEEPREEEPPAVAIPPVPTASAAAVARGARLYVELQCDRCHGPGGRGDGPAAPTLTDPRGRPLRPFDLTRAANLRSGGSAEAIYRVLMTGLDGTPMPSYASSLAPDDAWALVFHVRSLFLDAP